MAIGKLDKNALSTILLSAVAGGLLFTPTSVHASTGLGALGQMLFFFTIIVPSITLCICVLCLIIAMARSQSLALKGAFALVLLTIGLAGINLVLLSVNVLLFVGLPFVPLFLSITLLFFQLFGPVRTVAGYVLIAVITFFIAYLPQQQELFLKRFDSGGTKMQELRSVSFRLGPAVSFFPPAMRVLYNHRLITSDGEKIWFVSQYDRDFKNRTGENFLLHHYDKLSPIWETSVPFWESGQKTAYPKALASDRKGGVFLAGENYAEGTADHTAGGSWWIKHFDENGAEDPKWRMTFRERSNGGRGFYVYSLAVGPLDSLYVVCGLSRPGGEKGEIQIRKYWKTGETVREAWSVSIPSISGGHTWPPEKFDAASDPSGDLYVLIGETRPSTDKIYGPQRHTYTIKKLSSDSGSMIWESEGFSTADSKGMVRMALNKDSLYVLGTLVQDKDKAYAPMVRRFDLEGIEDSRWNKVIASPHGRSVVTGATFDGHDNVYLVGFQGGPNPAEKNGKWWLKKFSADGSEFQEWNQILIEDSSRETISWITVDAKGNPLVLGEAEAFIPAFLERFVY